MNNNSAWKLMTPVILVALFGYQNMQSKQAQTPQGNPQTPQGNPQTPQGNPQTPQGNPQTPQGNPQTPQGNPQTPQGNPQTPQGNPQTPQGNPQTPQGDPQSSGQQDMLAGTWQGQGVKDNTTTVAIRFSFQSGQFKSELQFTSNDGRSPSTDEYLDGIYQQTGPSYVLIPKRICSQGSCRESREPEELTNVSSTQFSWRGVTFRRVG